MSSKKENYEIEDFKKQLKIIGSISKYSLVDKNSKKKMKWIEELEKNNITYSNTYVIENKLIDPGLKYDYLIKILEGHGLKRSNDPKLNHLFGIIDNKFYNSQFFLLNKFQFIDSFKDKYSLYLNLQLYFRDHYYKTYPNSFLLSTNTNWNDINKLYNKKRSIVFIARPIEAMQGENIIKVWNEDTLNKAKELLYNDKYIKGVSLTEYITNPLLYNGKKMHLRAYMLMTLINNEYKSYLLDVSEIFTAKNKYKNEDWNNEDIHDTHFSNSGISYNFPDIVYETEKHKINNKFTPRIGEAEVETIMKNIRECINQISKIAISNIYHYSNTKNTYEVFGIDVLVKDDLSVFIMEVNGKYTGYGYADSIFERYFNWIHETVIKPCLFPQLETLKTLHTTPIYTAKIEDY
jgi:hypothetical protein